MRSTIANDSDYLGFDDLMAMGGNPVKVKIKAAPYVPVRNLKYNKRKAESHKNACAICKMLGPCKQYRQLSQEEYKRLVLVFEGKKKALPLNVVNREKLESKFGKETDEWIGKEITLWPDPAVKIGRETVGGVRIK